MNNLLNANMSKIFKSNYFYIGLVCSAVISLLWIFQIKNDGGTLSEVVTLPIFLMPMLIAAFVGLLTAPEFTHGTVRNKIIVGHQRENIFFSSLISFSAASLIFYIVYEVITFTVGAAVIGVSNVSWKAAAYALVVMAVLLVCSTAVSYFICMLVQGSRSLVLVLVLQYAMTFLGISSYLFVDNKLADVVAKFLPQGYYYELNIREILDKPWQPLVYPVLFGAALTLWGLYLFKKCDLK